MPKQVGSEMWEGRNRVDSVNEDCVYACVCTCLCVCASVCVRVCVHALHLHTCKLSLSLSCLSQEELLLASLVHLR